MGDYEFTLPRRLRGGQSAVLVITVGVLQKGHEIRVATSDDETIGTVSPFGVKSGDEAGTYVVAVPSWAIHDARLSVRLRVIGAFGARGPKVGEVKDLQLRVTPRSPKTSP